MPKITLGILFFMLCTARIVAASPKVVTSILPVHSLVAAVMQGTGEPLLLLQGGVSPHDYALRPSHMRALADADIVFWIGPALETALAKPLANMGDVRAEALLDTPGLNVLAVREGGLWEEDGHNHAHDSDAHAEDESADPHIWLNPDNASVMVKHIAAILSEADPANSLRYQSNAVSYRDHLATLSGQIERELSPLKHIPYIVFHDAYHYFEQRFDLQAAGSITLNPDRPPGARRIQQIRARISANQIRCVFSEPQFQPALVQTLIDGTATRTAVLDPLGTHLTPGPDAYPKLLEALTQSLRACLQN